MILALLLSLTLSNSAQCSSHAHPIQDTLPPLHTIRDQDISYVTPSFSDDVITVTMKNGKIYVYEHKDWDLEDTYPQTPEKIKKAISSNSKTFTKVEQKPEFPGGEEAWNRYIDSFCVAHKKEIRKAGAVEVMVQFIVHMKGQLTYIEVSGTPANKRQAELAIQALREGPLWIPAVQNGHNVVSYARQKVSLH